jgi:hypothetical protein
MAEGNTVCSTGSGTGVRTPPPVGVRAQMGSFSKLRSPALWMEGVRNPLPSAFSRISRNHVKGLPHWLYDGDSMAAYPVTDVAGLHSGRIFAAIVRLSARGEL